MAAPAEASKMTERWKRRVIPFVSNRGSHTDSLLALALLPRSRSQCNGTFDQDQLPGLGRHHQRGANFVDDYNERTALESSDLWSFLFLPPIYQLLKTLANVAQTASDVNQHT